MRQSIWFVHVATDILLQQNTKLQKEWTKNNSAKPFAWNALMNWLSKVNVVLIWYAGECIIRQSKTLKMN